MRLYAAARSFGCTPCHRAIAPDATGKGCSVNLVLGLMIAAVLAVDPPVQPARKAPAAPAEAIPLFLQTDAGDELGAVYVSRFRDALRESHDYRTVTSPSDARFIVSILTMDPSEGDGTPVNTTVAGITLQRENRGGRNQFVYSWVLVAKRGNVAILADRLLEAIDAQIRDFEGLNDALPQPAPRP
jgi:hypothetical protein